MFAKSTAKRSGLIDSREFECTCGMASSSGTIGGVALTPLPESARGAVKYARAIHGREGYYGEDEGPCLWNDRGELQGGGSREVWWARRLFLFGILSKDLRGLPQTRLSALAVPLSLLARERHSRDWLAAPNESQHGRLSRPVGHVRGALPAERPPNVTRLDGESIGELKCPYYSYVKHGERR